MSKYFLIICFIIFTAAICHIFILTAQNTYAADYEGTLLEKLELKCAGGDAKKPDSIKDCNLNDFMQIAINVSNIILGLTGSLALVAFIYGGVVMLLSGGSSEKVTQAKSIIFGAVIGLVIVFASYTIINFIAKAMGATSIGLK